MHKVLIALIVGFLTAGQAAASEKAAVMAAVHQIVDGFNKGDTKSLLSTCANETSIIDEVPPHEWHGDDTHMSRISAFSTHAVLPAGAIARRRLKRYCSRRHHYA